MNGKKAKALRRLAEQIARATRNNERSVYKALKKEYNSNKKEMKDIKLITDKWKEVPTPNNQ